MGKKFVILLTPLMKEEEQRRFDFLDKYGVSYEYLPEYRDDEREPIKRHLQLEKEGPDSFTYSDAYIQKLREADVIISFYSPVPTAAYENGKTEVVIILRSGVENINLQNATAAEVKVINAPGRLAAPVAEFSIGLIISEMKNIARSHEKLMHGEWCTKYANSPFLYNIKGRNVGIVGCGAVGKRVAEAMKAMEANVLVYDPYCTSEALQKQGYESVSLDELCERADVISVHYRLTEETENLINASHFAKMKPTAYLINTARAGLVEENALLNALEQKKIAGAALDVFYQEPLDPSNRLLQLDNVTLTPHLAGTCTDIMDLTLDVVMKCIVTYFEKGIWTNVVNK